jgi:tetratricopeptide (TPR) repeat protein
MLTAYPNRAETWTTIALYYELKGKKQQAFIHLERALSCNPRHALAHELKGWLLIAISQLEAAIIPFKTAIQLTKDLSAYKGILFLIPNP